MIPAPPRGVSASAAEPNQACRPGSRFGQSPSLRGTLSWTVLQSFPRERLPFSAAHSSVATSMAHVELKD